MDISSSRQNLVDLSDGPLGTAQASFSFPSHLSRSWESKEGNNKGLHRLLIRSQRVAHLLPLPIRRLSLTREPRLEANCPNPGFFPGGRAGRSPRPSLAVILAFSRSPTIYWVRNGRHGWLGNEDAPRQTEVESPPRLLDLPQLAQRLLAKVVDDSFFTRLGKVPPKLAVEVAAGSSPWRT